MKFAIEINKVTKTFGSLTAVDNFTLNIKKGEMFGLVGPDGAGKTTLIRELCGLSVPDSGDIFLLGMNIKKDRKKIQSKIGYLSQKFSLYGDLTVDENIEFFAEVHGVSGYHAKRDELLVFTRLKPFRKRLADKLSGGMKQKLALACSLIHKPEILFLDEPTTGVDPVSRRDFWKILSNLLSEGMTIFYTTPYMDEAERCSYIAMMHKGKIIAQGNVTDIKNKLDKSILELSSSNIIATNSFLKTKSNYSTQLFGDRIHILLNKQNEHEEIRNLLTSNNFIIEEYRFIPPSFENVFIYLVGNDYN
ncbi:MAG: ABC transporter ATP-binding protein [Ignavibacteriaceae bacterium]|nr:ABC transporter ATP-binding protein [Ignavibacteriaceae bacterium]